MIGLNKIGLNQVQLNLVQLNQLYLNTLCAGQKRSGGDGFPRLPGDVTRWSFKGLTNEMMAKNPRLEDADHKGRFLTFKNFAWAGMSGVGGYKYNFLSNDWNADVNQLSVVLSHKIVIINKRTSVQLAKWIRNELENTINITLKITGLEANGSSFKIYDNVGSSHAQRYKKDGIYQINYTATEGANRFFLYVLGGNMGQLEHPITIEQLPLYPDALVFDGVDDYSVCDNFPILTKEKGYTVVALRQWISNKISSTFIHKGTLSSEGAFIFEFIRGTGEENISSFGKATITDISKKAFSYQTSKSYNGVSITSGNKEDGNVLRIGKGVYENYTNIAIWELIILDHDATEEELTKIKNYFIKTYPWLFFDQAWTVTGKSNKDTDRATIANITGNGNNLVLSNFGFARNSGYSEWPAIVLNSGLSTNQPYGTLYFKESDYASAVTEYSGSFNFKFRVRELPDGGNFAIRGYREDSPTENAVITKIYNANGVYELSYDDNNVPIRLVFYNGKSSSNRSSFYVDIIPDHEGYLVTDGVDDIVASSSFELDKKFTVVGEWKFINNESKRAGIVFPSKLYAYNEKENMLVYINTPITGNTLQNIRSFKALTSDGKLYDNNWEERVLKAGDTGLIRNTITFGGFIQNNVFTQIAFKNLGIYNSQTLSKEDCIKAYNYLQTLKAK